MNILNILGIVPATQKNASAGQAISPAGQSQSLFLPMFLQFFAANTTKTGTLPFSQDPVIGTALPANDLAQPVKSSANRDEANDDSSDTGLEFLSNRIARFGSVFSVFQNVKSADGMASIPAGTGTIDGSDPNGISAGQTPGENGIDASTEPPVQDAVTSVANDLISVPASAPSRRRLMTLLRRLMPCLQAAWQLQACHRGQ